MGTNGISGNQPLFNIGTQKIRVADPVAEMETIDFSIRNTDKEFAPKGKRLECPTGQGAKAILSYMDLLEKTMLPRTNFLG